MPDVEQTQETTPTVHNAPDYPSYVSLRRGEAPKEAAATEPEAKTAAESDTATEEQVVKERDEKGRFKDKDSEVPVSVQKRIDKAIAKQREAERKAADAESKLKELTAPKEQKNESKDTKDDPEPKLNDFEDYESYNKAVAKWTAKSVLKEAEAERTKAEAKRSHEQRASDVQKAFDESISEFSKEHPDYHEVIQNAVDETAEGKLPRLPDHVINAIAESDTKAGLLYHIAKNSAELERLSHVSPERIGYEIGKLEARISSPVPEKKSTTSAPRPPSPVGTRGGSGTPDIYDPKLPFKDFVKVRTAGR